MARVPMLVDFSQQPIRVLHYTWIAFFITFFLWFNMAPLATTMLASVDWLTEEHLKLLAICNVALTIPARILIGVLIDRFGPRLVYSGLMITMSFPVFLFAFGNNFTQLLIARLMLSCVGAGFVVGIRMVAEWFPPRLVGRAEGFYAGWGNFGSAWAAMTLPWLALHVFGGYEDGWRYAIAVNGLVSLVYGVMYYFLVSDTPEGKAFLGVKKTQPMLVSSWGDLAQYLVWSAPLMGALGLLAWRVSNIPAGEGESGYFLSEPMLYLILAGLLLVYIVHCLKTLQVNVPHLRRGVAPEDRYPFASVAALNTTYFANFGAELAVVSMLPIFFQSTFTITPMYAGLLASSFAVINLVARPVGGLLSDVLGNRKRIMLIYMCGIALGFVGMGLVNSSWPIWVAVVVTVACSVFVQGAEGATFAIIPFINRRMTGQIAGMAGAYGNVGAVTYLVIFSLVEPATFFFILAGGAAASLLFCLFFLREPEGSFAEAYVMKSGGALPATESSHA